MKFIALLLSLLLLAGYAYVVFKFSTELIKIVATIKNKPLRIIYSTSFLLPGLALFFLLNEERFIYFWDYSGYWHGAITFHNNFFDNPFRALIGVYTSIKHDIYNSSPNLLPVAVNHFLGLNFNSYVFSVYLVYLVPFSLVFSSIIIRLNPDTNIKFKLALPFFILCFTPCLIPIRYGFLDIAGLIYVAIAMLLLTRSNYYRELNVKNAIVSGVVLLLLIFTRRWYSFWFVAYFIAVFTVNLIVAIKRKNRKIIINTCINLAISGSTAVVIMLVFFYPFFEMTVLKDYKDIYSAYRSSSYMHQLDNFKHFFGLLIIIIAIAGIFLSIKKHKSLTAFFITGSIIIIFLFIRVNDFGGLQHYYLLVPFFLYFFLQTAAFFSNRKYILASLFALLLVNNYFVFALNPTTTTHVFSNIQGKAFFRTDYDQIEKISNRIIELQNSGEYVYIVASGTTLNEDIIKNIKLPDISNPIFKMLNTQHVDKRDRFPNTLFLADYIITTSPDEIHLGAENQQVVVYFNNAIMNGYLKHHYEKVEEFPLINNMKAFLMKRTSSLSNAEIQTMHDYFKKAYPEYEQMYDVNRSMLKICDINVGNGYGMANFENENTINLCPGSERPSEMSFMFDENDKTLSFTATFNNKETLVRECNSEKDGEVNLIIKENGNVIKTIYLTHKQDEKITLDVSGKKKITITVDKGKNEDYCDWFRIIDFHIK
ncbi:hypothetical protein ACX0HA_02195 [Flavobacterium hauense]